MLRIEVSESEYKAIAFNEYSKIDKIDIYYKIWEQYIKACSHNKLFKKGFFNNCCEVLNVRFRLKTVEQYQLLPNKSYWGLSLVRDVLMENVLPNKKFKESEKSLIKMLFSDSVMLRNKHVINLSEINNILMEKENTVFDTAILLFIVSKFVNIDNVIKEQDIIYESLNTTLKLMENSTASYPEVLSVLCTFKVSYPFNEIFNSEKFIQRFDEFFECVEKRKMGEYYSSVKNLLSSYNNNNNYVIEKDNGDIHIKVYEILSKIKKTLYSLSQQNFSSSKINNSFLYILESINEKIVDNDIVVVRPTNNINIINNNHTLLCKGLKKNDLFEINESIKDFIVFINSLDDENLDCINKNPEMIIPIKEKYEMEKINKSKISVLNNKRNIRKF